MGRPINKTAQSERTFRIFGFDGERGYLDKYPIKESIEDERMVPIKHMTTLSTMTVRAERLDSEFFALTETKGFRHRGTQLGARPRLMRLVAEMGLLALYRHACVPDRGLTRPPP